MRCQTLFFFYNSFPVHAVDGLVMIYYPGIFFFFFFCISCRPPSLSLGPLFDRHCPAGWKIFDSSPRSQIYDYYFFGMWWDCRLGNSLNNTEHLKEEAVLLPTSNRTKVVWTERPTLPSAEPPVLSVKIFDLLHGWTSRGKYQRTKWWK